MKFQADRQARVEGPVVRAESLRLCQRTGLIAPIRHLPYDTYER